MSDSLNSADFFSARFNYQTVHICRYNSSRSISTQCLFKPDVQNTFQNAIFHPFSLGRVVSSIVAFSEYIDSTIIDVDNIRGLC